MKTILLVASTLVSFTGFTMAEGDCEKGACTSEKVAVSEKCPEGKCDDELANQTKFVVTGMTCGGCSKSLTAKLGELEGVTVKKVCHKSGNVIVTIDPDKSSKEKVQATITKAGFKVANNDKATAAKS